ncbi:MAG: PAS domain S-box protein [Verrucomicrobia bacterium]|nr:MAG: PAS domain S-box protein [Verrucomicrobiota bacterium]
MGVQAASNTLVSLGLTDVKPAVLPVLFDRLADQVVALDAEGRILYANPSWYAALGLTATQGRSLAVWEVLPPAQVCRWKRWLEAPSVLSPQALVRVVWLGAEGQAVPAEGSFAVTGEEEKGIRLLGVFHDISRWLRLQEALRENRAMHHLLSAHVPVGVFQTDLEGRLLRTNALWRRMAGLEHVPEPRGVWWQMVATQDRPRVLGGWQSFLRHGHEFICEFEVNTGTRGPRRYARVRMVQVPDELGAGMGCVGVAEDITEQRRLEQERLQMEAQLRQQQRLDSIGTLASGVAHEVNNPISGIMNYAEIIRDEAPRTSRIRTFADEILHESGRVAKIVRNLLTFARQEKQDEHVPVPLNEVVEGTLSLIRTLIRHDRVRLEVDLPPDLPVVSGRSQQLQQVLMNLLLNGRDALNEKYPGHHPDKLLRLTAARFERQGQPWVRLTVEDHGPGIPPEVQERMFEPFFTTKSRHKGTGLGLAITLGIVQEHLGQLRVETEPGQWTRFHIELPVAEEFDRLLREEAAAEGEAGAEPSTQSA